MQAAENPAEPEECNVKVLVSKYGPDYEPLKQKLSFIKGIFDDIKYV